MPVSQISRERPLSDMKLEELLSQKRSSIVKRWFHLILETYPSDTSTLLKKQKDQFSNPVGYTISQGIEGVFEGLVTGAQNERTLPFLDKVIRVRAIQDFTPAQAIDFVFILKEVIREELKKEIREQQLFEDLLVLESRIDDLARSSFNIYMECREKIYELKANELKRWTHNLLERVNETGETRDKKSD